MLGSLNNWNIINLTNKNTLSEDFDEVNQLVLDGISNNMSSLVHTGKYGAINTADTKTLGRDVVKYLYQSYTLKEDKITYGQVGKEGDLVVKYE